MVNFLLAAIVAASLVSAVPQNWENWNKKEVNSTSSYSSTRQNHTATAPFYNNTAVTTVVTTKTRTFTAPCSTDTLSAGWAKQPALFSQSAPTATLSPALHWDHQSQNLKHVVPGESCKMYYAGGQSNPNKAHQMAWLNITFSSQAVVLDHSKFMTYAQTSSGGISVSFSSAEAYQQSKSTWSSAPSLILIANKPGFCGQGDGESCYFKVDTLNFQEIAHTCTASGGFKTVTDVMVRADVEWGAYVPGAPGPRFTPGSGATKSYPGSTVTSTTSSGGAGSTSLVSGGSSTTAGQLGSSTTSGRSATASGSSPTAAQTGSSTTAVRAGSSTTAGRSVTTSSSSTVAGQAITTSGSLTTTTQTDTLSGSLTTTARLSTTSGSSSGLSTVSGANPTSNGNSTLITGSTAPSNATNCTAPVDTKYGLPVACLGAYFDQTLDDNYGYEGIGDTDYASFLAGFNDLEFPDASTDPNDPNFATDDVLFDKRGKILKWFAKKVLAPVAKAVGLPTKYQKTVQRQYPISVPADRQLVASPWGQQVLIRSFKQDGSTSNAKLDIYCVDCGAKGQANIAGQVSVSLEEGIESLSANFQGDLTVAVKVGVDVNIQIEKTFSQQLFQVGIPGTCVAGIVCVGPSVKMGADVTFKADASGQLLAGATVTIHDARAGVDMLASQKGSASGWQPEFIPTLEAKGQIALSADFGVPIAIAIGVDILNGKWKKEMALIDRPSIEAKAAFSGSAGINGAGGVTGAVGTTNGCRGIATKISLKNKMWAEVPGFSPWVLADMNPKTLSEKCIPVGDQSSPSTTTTTTTTTSTTTSTTTTTTSTTSETTSSTTTTIAEDPNVTGTATDPNATETATDPNATGAATETNTSATTGAAETNTSTDSPTESPTASDDSPSATPTSDSSAPTTTTPAAGDNAGGETAQPTEPLVENPAPTPIGKRSDEQRFVSRQAADSSTISATVDDTAAEEATGTDDLADYTLPEPADTSYNTTDGYTMASLIDESSTYQILPCNDGNVYLFGINATVPQYDCSDMWTMSPNPDDSIEGTLDDRVVADAMGRIPHYYPDEMTKTGVSRLRVSDVENIPVGVENVYFLNLDVEDETGDLYFAIDLGEIGYYPIVCDFVEDTLNAKVFLAADADAGIEMLKSPDIKYSITGGTVRDCWYVPLVLGS